MKTTFSTTGVTDALTSSPTLLSLALMPWIQIGDPHWMIMSFSFFIFLTHIAVFNGPCKLLTQVRPQTLTLSKCHDDVIKWKYFPRYWPFVRGIHRSPVNFPHKGQWRGAFMFSLICAWIKGWVNNREAGDLRRHRTHYDVIVMLFNRQIW